MGSLNEIDWDAIANAYAKADTSVAEVCSQHGISPSALYARARKHNWPSRRTRKDREQRHGALGKKRDGNSGNQSRDQCRKKEPVTSGTKTDVAGRLQRAMEKKLEMIERRLNSGEEVSPADSEREARELGALMRNFERLGLPLSDATDGKPTARKSEKSVSIATTTDEGIDLEQWRLELAQRIARLRESGAA